MAKQKPVPIYRLTVKYPFMDVNSPGNLDAKFDTVVGAKHHHQVFEGSAQSQFHVLVWNFYGEQEAVAAAGRINDLGVRGCTARVTKHQDSLFSGSGAQEPIG
jgi:hypothetical protein